MFDKFTDRARKVMALAREEAKRFNHEYIGTEHILLGLVKEGSGVAANVLQNLDIDLKKIRMEVEKIVQSGPDLVSVGQLPFTSNRKIEIIVDCDKKVDSWQVCACHMSWLSEKLIIAVLGSSLNLTLSLQAP